MEDQGTRSHLMSEITERGLDAVVDDAVVHAARGVDAVFLSIDIDVVDPGMAPGTGTPEPGASPPANCSTRFDVSHEN
jgi:agmatinase